MLKLDTVFVMGAALSWEIGLPLGEELKAKIIKLLPNQHGEDGDRVMRSLLATQPAYNQYFTASEAMKVALPFAASIDNLIEHHADDEIFVQVAKWAIAVAIARAENESSIGLNFTNRTTRDLTPHSYKALFRLIVAGVPKPHLAAAFSRLKVVTFNYDRTLEVFLVRALQNYSGLASDEAARIVDQATFLHAYGALDAEATASRSQFRPINDHTRIAALAAGLRTFSEKRISGEDKPITELVKFAERLVFLGCAFHRPNLNLIKPPDLNATEVYGTVYVPAPQDPAGFALPDLAAFSQPTIENMTQELMSWRHPQRVRGLVQQNIHLRPMTCLQLIGHYGSTWCD